MTRDAPEEEESPKALDPYRQVIHDLRDSLNAVVSALKVIELSIDDRTEIQEMVEIAQRGCDTSIEHIERLREIVRSQGKPGG